MNEVRMHRQDLSTKLYECYTMALFLSNAIELILEEHGNFTDKCPVPYGAGGCITVLADKIKAIEQEI